MNIAGLRNVNDESNMTDKVLNEEVIKKINSEKRTILLITKRKRKFIIRAPTET